MKTLLICLVLLGATAGSGSAGPGSINLGWLDCPGKGEYHLTRTFACDTNIGEHVLVGSFVAPPGMLAVWGFSAAIDLQTPGPLIAPWWDVRASLPAGCRPFSFSSSFDFTGGPGSCFDYWQGGATGGNSATVPFFNRTQLRLTAALPGGDSRIGPIPEGTEVYCFKAIINNAKTVGLGACAGCTAEACLVLNLIRVAQVPGTAGGNFELTTPGTSAHVIWQSWTNTDPNQNCPYVTPARNRTWGSIKAIYR